MAMDKIGKYQIRRELGRGGMATVFEAWDPTFDRTIALKVLPDELLHDGTFRARFEREAKTIAALEHPAIVPVYDYGEADHKVFLAMRYMGGGSLADKLRVGRLPVAAISKIYERVAPALDLAHGKGVVHRDLKPGNVLFDDNGEPYVSDFGIAKLAITSNTELTQGGAIGTPSYMSPEQARGERLDGRSDIYAMGVMLFEMLAGRLPYTSETPTGMMMKHILDPIPRLDTVAPGLPGAWQAVIDRALAKRPDDRYANMASLANDLRAIAEGRSMSATPPMESPNPIVQPGAPVTQVYGSPSYGQVPVAAPLATGPQAPRPGTPPRPITAVPTPSIPGAPAVLPAQGRRISPLLIVLGVAGACVLIGSGLAVVSTLGALGGAFPAAPAATAAATLAPPTVRPPTAIQVTLPAATAIPATARPAASPTIPPTATPRASTLDANSMGSLRELRVMADSTDTVVRSVGFGPDGVTIFGSLGNTPNQAIAQNRFQVWRRADGSTQARFTMGSIPWTSDVSPDGKSVVIAVGKQAALYKVADGQIIRQLATVALEMGTAQFSPDGRLVAAGGVDAIGKTPIQIFASDTGARVFQVDNGYNMGSLRFSADGGLLAASTSLGQVTVWRVNDGRRVMSYKFDTNGASVPAAFSPDGRYFAAAACAKTCSTGDQTSDARVWKTADWTVAASFKEDGNALESLGFPTSGDLLFVGGRTRSKFYRLADLIKDPSTAAFRLITLAGVTSVDFSADGRLAVFGTSSSGVRLWGMP
ncbi:MAG TPA: protein kinase [Thermoflexales bacterium]|jgi:serine/threonine-protein kinase|nr:protein kinase [Thermoflexales bacterium]